MPFFLIDLVWSGIFLGGNWKGNQWKSFWLGDGYNNFIHFFRVLGLEELGVDEMVGNWEKGGWFLSALPSKTWTIYFAVYIYMDLLQPFLQILV